MRYSNTQNSEWRAHETGQQNTTTTTTYDCLYTMWTNIILHKNRTTCVTIKIIKAYKTLLLFSCFWTLEIWGAVWWLIKKEAANKSLISLCKKLVFWPFGVIPRNNINVGVKYVDKRLFYSSAVVIDKICPHQWQCILCVKEVVCVWHTKVTRWKRWLTFNCNCEYKFAKWYFFCFI